MRRRDRNVLEKEYVLPIPRRQQVPEKGSTFSMFSDSGEECEDSVYVRQIWKYV